MPRTNEEIAQLARHIYEALRSTEPNYETLVKFGEVIYARLPIESPKIPDAVMAYLFKVGKRFDELEPKIEAQPKVEQPKIEAQPKVEQPKADAKPPDNHRPVVENPSIEEGAPEPVKTEVTEAKKPEAAGG